MPELPEVETVKNVLNNIVTGRTIKKIDVLRKTTIEGNTNEFVNLLTNQTFNSISRIGKFLIFHLTNNQVIISHLRMEGKYYEVNEKDENTKYARVVFHLDNDKKLCYDDSRTFGKMMVSTEENYKKEKAIAKLGPEPFEINDVSELMARTKRTTTAIKTTLLDQTLMTGLGNIYVDETLYASKIHPHTPANLITKKQWQEIVKNAQEILQIAIEMGGSTIKSYHPGKGIDGNFQTRIKIYGKSGEVCPICHKTYRFKKTNGRGTTFCPGCQQKHGAPLLVALTGKIASGKSTVSEIFKKRGYEVISADKIVHELYNNSQVAAKLEKILHISFKSTRVDLDILRNHLVLNPKDKKKVEAFIHPLVKKEILTKLKASKDKIKVAEVPLLFESKMDANFDYIIGVDISEKEQLKRLEKRNGDKGVLLKEINKTSKFEENKNKVEFLVDNSGSLANLEKQVNKIIDKLEENLI